MIAANDAPQDIQATFAATAPVVAPPEPRPVKRIASRKLPANAIPSCDCGRVRPPQYVQIGCEGKRCLPAWVRKTPEVPWWDVQAWIVWTSKVLHYLGWLSSPLCDEPTELHKNHACVTLCQFAIKKDGHVWCPFCGCPQIPEADVRVKNKREGHNCPIGMHAGSTPEPGPFAAARKAFGLSLVNPKKRKCGGCGG